MGELQMAGAPERRRAWCRWSLQLAEAFQHDDSDVAGGIAIACLVRHRKLNVRDTVLEPDVGLRLKRRWGAHRHRSNHADLGKPKGRVHGQTMYCNLFIAHTIQPCGPVTEQRGTRSINATHTGY